MMVARTMASVILWGNMAVKTDIFGSIIEPKRGALSLEHARYVLSLKFTDAEQARSKELSYKAQDGTLTPKERHELDRLLMANSFLIVLKAKARQSLKRHPSAA
jgi:hypothetical protein